MFQHTCIILRENIMPTLKKTNTTAKLSFIGSVCSSLITDYFIYIARQSWHHLKLNILVTPTLYLCTSLLITLKTTCAKFCSSKAQRPYHGSGGLSMASHSGGMISIPGKFMWHFWWTLWQWYRFSQSIFGFTCQHDSTSVPHSFFTHLPLKLYNRSNWWHH